MNKIKHLAGTTVKLQVQCLLNTLTYDIMNLYLFLTILPFIKI
jgi:hypothetical protein